MNVQSTMEDAVHAVCAPTSLEATAADLARLDSMETLLLLVWTSTNARQLFAAMELAATTAPPATLEQTAPILHEASRAALARVVFRELATPIVQTSMNA